MRVLHVCEYVKGGTATSVGTLVNSQLSDPTIDEVRVLVSKQHRKYIDVPSEHLICFDYPQRSAKALYHLAKAIRSAVAEFRPTVMHLQGTMAGAVGRSLRALHLLGKSCPAIVYCSRGWAFTVETSRTRQTLYAFIERGLSYYCDKIICISDNELMEALGRGIPEGKCVRVYNGIQQHAPPEDALPTFDQAIPNLDPNALRFLFVGRYDHQKGLDILLDAFAMLPPTHVLFTAGSPVVSRGGWEFGSNVTDCGWVSPGQLSFLLSNCDAIVVPSRWEGFGLVAIEAMRAGRAVVCSQSGGLPEIVVPDVTGVLFETLEPVHISQVLGSLSRDRLRAMGEKGHQRFNQMFTSTRLHEETLSIYRSAIEVASV